MDIDGIRTLLALSECSGAKAHHGTPIGLALRRSSPEMEASSALAQLVAMQALNDQSMQGAS